MHYTLTKRKQGRKTRKENKLPRDKPDRQVYCASKYCCSETKTLHHCNITPHTPRMYIQQETTRYLCLLYLHNISKVN